MVTDQQVRKLMKLIQSEENPGPGRGGFHRIFSYRVKCRQS